MWPHLWYRRVLGRSFRVIRRGTCRPRRPSSRRAVPIPRWERPPTAWKESKTEFKGRMKISSFKSHRLFFPTPLHPLHPISFSASRDALMACRMALLFKVVRGNQKKKSFCPLATLMPGSILYLELKVNLKYSDTAACLETFFGPNSLR